MEIAFPLEVRDYSDTFNSYALQRNRVEKDHVIGEGVATIPEDGFKSMTYEESLAELTHMIDIGIEEADAYLKALEEDEKSKHDVLTGYVNACRKEYDLFGYKYDPSIDDHEKNFQRNLKVVDVQRRCRKRAQQMREKAISKGCDEAFEAVGETLTFNDYDEYQRYLLQNGLIDPKEYCTERAREQQIAKLKLKCRDYFSRHNVPFDDNARMRIGQLVSEKDMAFLDACRKVVDDYKSKLDARGVDFQRIRRVAPEQRETEAWEVQRATRAKAQAEAEAEALLQQQALQAERQERILQAALTKFMDDKDEAETYIEKAYALNNNRHVDEALARSILKKTFDANRPRESVQELDKMLRELKRKVEATIEASEEVTGNQLNLQEELQQRMEETIESNDVSAATDVAITAHRLHEEGRLSEKAVLGIGETIGEMAAQPEIAVQIVERALNTVQGEVPGFTAEVFNSLRDVKEAQLMNSEGVRDICKLAKQYPKGHHLGFMAWIRNQRPETTQEEFAIALKCFDEDYSKVNRITQIRQRLLQNPYVSEESKRRMTWWERLTTAVKSFFRRLLAPFRSQYHGHQRRRTPRRC